MVTGTQLENIFDKFSFDMKIDFYIVFELGIVCFVVIYPCVYNFSDPTKKKNENHTAYPRY